MKGFYFCTCLLIVLISSCDDHDDEYICMEEIHVIDFDHPQAGQKSVYLKFNAPDYYNYASDEIEFTQDSLVMEVIGENVFGIRIREYYTAGSPILSEPDQLIDTAYYSIKVNEEFITFDWDQNSAISPRGRLFDYGVQYPMNTEPYEFDKLNWKVFPSPEMPQFGVTGVVKSYQPIDDNFGDCMARFDLGTVFAHIERPMWIYQPKLGLITRYTEITSSSYAFGYILTLEP